MSGGLIEHMTYGRFMIYILLNPVIHYHYIASIPFNFKHWHFCVFAVSPFSDTLIPYRLRILFHMWYTNSQLGSPSWCSRLLPKSEAPKLLRGCGRAPTNADLKELLESVSYLSFLLGSVGKQQWKMGGIPKTYRSENLKFIGLLHACAHQPRVSTVSRH